MTFKVVSYNLKSEDTKWDSYLLCYDFLAT